MGAISYALIRQMGGDIDVESELGVGSSFTVRLPMAMREKKDRSHIRRVEESMDAFLHKYPADVEQLARATRAFLLQLIPGAIETIDPTSSLIGYGVGPGFKALVCTIILNRMEVKIGITHSASMQDPTGLLAGNAMHHRYVLLENESELENPALLSLLQESMSRVRREMR